jgi:MraZ protein
VEPTFFSWYVNKIDAKGRASVPAPFRQALEGQRFNGIIAVPSFKHPMVEGSGIDRTDWMRRQLANLAEFSDEYDSVQSFFSETVPVQFDGEGRIILPRHLLDHAGIKDQIVFAGAGDVFQMWEPAAYERHRAVQLERRRAGQGLWSSRRALAEGGS